ncbi:hypothetical protein [Streptomyces sp. SAI-090]|uniref:hypothetical protein n=1 Tax=Streptomyces sp. SAI-090 TaxID=2940545 RepID=UPI0024763AFF|nr:hypothetical protein [Streptomyces sp. SAI-090]MDH6522245.1 hypothetical protein [Streptomyces sp. SAI-090]
MRLRCAERDRSAGRPRRQTYGYEADRIRVSPDLKTCDDRATLEALDLAVGPAGRPASEAISLVDVRWLEQEEKAAAAFDAEHTTSACRCAVGHRHAFPTPFGLPIIE